MKKAIAMLVCALLCLAVLGGCGGDAADVPEEITSARENANENTSENISESAGTEETQSGADTTTKEQEAIPVTTQRFDSPAEGADDFAFRLSKALLKDTGKGNFVSSPLSVWLPLAALVNATDAAHKPALLAALGAAGFKEKDINEAAAQMLYQLTNERSREYGKEFYYNPLRIANAVFVGKGMKLRKGFSKPFEDSFQGSAQAVDFASPSAVKAVNDWADKHTKGLIKEIVQEFDPQTVAAIANAIYFSDRWDWEFNPERTKKDTFHGTNGDADAFFMLREGDEQTYYEDGKLQAMPLAFKTGGALYILLPKDGDAVSLLSGMTPGYFKEIQEDSIRATGKLLLPRFKIDSGTMDLVQSLTALGVPLFDERSAPLTGGLLEQDIPVWLSGAVQKAVIEVDEKGTTAAAVTVLMACGAALPQPTEPFSMVCDKPFAFVLCGQGGQGGQILFTGVVNQV